MGFLLQSPSGLSHKIQGAVTSLGRSSENDICIADSAISRHHLNFFIKDNQIIVEDAGSQNGFLLNGQQCHSATVLKQGDLISFGRSIYAVTHENYSGSIDFNRLKKSSSNNNSKTPNASTIEVKDVPQFNNKRLLIYGALALFLVFIALNEGKSKFDPSNRNKTEEALAPLPTDGYIEKSAPPKTQSELMAASRYREAIRDYYNDNYARAITGFQSALTLDPSNENARNFLERSETQLKSQIEDLVFHADKAFRLLHFKSSKALAIKALNILSERTPGYIRKIAQQDAGISDNVTNSAQEDSLSNLPCSQTQYTDFCKKSVEILDRSRNALNEKDVLK